MVGCNQEDTARDMSADQVVKAHFKYWNEKDFSELEGTISPDRKGITWELNKLEYVKLISIKEKNIGQKNEKEFEVQFEIMFKNGYGSGLSNGKYNWTYLLKRDSDSSPWLIYDWGV